MILTLRVTNQKVIISNCRALPPPNKKVFNLPSRANTRGARNSTIPTVGSLHNSLTLDIKSTSLVLDKINYSLNFFGLGPWHPFKKQNKDSPLFKNWSFR